ncbi:unnamed protein product [Danaus chrysippus]|uniref:N(6)-L-threonylcarbamoyladenine synthase n=1 Tax=Danaus chrysippus TaxID=151541 RepID=A0A8J2VQR2_9NEOP|nr:unnamed protein product [Danaus chrysippus]
MQFSKYLPRIIRYNLRRCWRKNDCRYKSFSSSSPIVLGIETSCDDTGCAILNRRGDILGETLFSQTVVHLRYGGVNPLIARDMHRENIEKAVFKCLENSSLSMDNIDAIAVTVKPGLLISLEIGVKYAKYLSKIYKKPLIPIHHMEAHALAARMFQDIQLPFLTLLISGGNCLLAFVREIDDFLLLGDTLDNSPGEVFDKAARRMKLRNLPEYSGIAGGRAIEMAAKKAVDPFQFDFPLPLNRNRDCNFSFSGLQDSFLRHLLHKEKYHNIMGDEIIPEVNDLCAAFQLAMAEHIAHRTERAIKYCEMTNLFRGDVKNIVVSGGVACNDFIFKSIECIGNKYGCKVFRPPPKLCTDNGVMIAWNALEKLKHKSDSVNEPLEINPTAPLGKNIIDKVKESDIQVRVTRLKKFNIM